MHHAFAHVHALNALAETCALGVLQVLSPRCPMEPGYVGALPVDLWLMTMPGVFVGSLLGPTVARVLGARNVIWLFCFCLVGDAVENSLRLSGVMGETCQAVGSQDCVLWCHSFAPGNSSLYSEPPSHCVAQVNQPYVFHINSTLPPYTKSLNGSLTFNRTSPPPDIKDPAASDRKRNASGDDHAGDVDAAVSFTVDVGSYYYFDGMQHIDLFSTPECCPGFGARDVPAQSPPPAGPPIHDDDIIYTHPTAGPPIHVRPEVRPSEAVAEVTWQPADVWVPSERVAEVTWQPADGWLPSGAHRRTAAEGKRVLHATTLLPG